ncbi:membrane lipoprotein lipid attachment site-containing protein [Eremococcus coleocola]|uniref:membrane lipoprotein lipid attachment site-containing protein n=1 Tax=Eremococcus coleocola TaxID=88132 RepID=UPI0004879F69|nr:membrane lipoprotein lipid attachment site-containing protein [Eremococcus coleocola]
MKKTILYLTSLIVLSGCSFFQENSPAQSSKQSSEIQAVSSEASQERTNESQTAESQVDQTNEGPVFQEEELSSTNLPQSSLDESVNYQELRDAVNQYYDQEVDSEVKELNQELIAEDDLENLQYVFDNNDQYKDLGVQVDQVKIPLGGTDNYVVRLIVADSYAATEAKVEGADILLLNESFAQTAPDRLVLLEYFDQEAGTIIPMHLSTSNQTIFYNQVEEDKLNQ